MVGVDWARRLLPAVALLALTIPGSSARSAVTPNAVLTVVVAHGAGGAVEVRYTGFSASCADTCSYSLASGTNVDLIPIERSRDWVFAGWSGACSAARGPCRGRRRWGESARHSAENNRRR